MEALTVPVVLAMIAAPAAIFRRRHKDEWLGELDGIRDDALGGSGDEIGPAMAGADAPAVDGAIPTPPGPTPSGPTTPGPTTPDAAEGRPPSGHEASASAPSGGRSDVAATGTPSPQEGSHHAAPRVPRPAPNRDRPTELWHAPLDLDALTISPEMAPEEHLGSADLVDPPNRGPALSHDLIGARGPVPVADLSADRSSAVVADREVEEGSGGDVPDTGGAGRPRLRPPTDIFDIAPVVDPEPGGPPGGPPGESSGAADDAAGLVGEPVGRRPRRATGQRSLFGGGGHDGLPSQQGPAQQTVEVSDGGEVVDQRGTIRLAERTRPEILRSPSDDSLSLESGWCWVARASAVPPARISLPVGVLVVPGATRVLAVVESDRSAFVSVVSGAAHLEHPDGLVPLPAGSISHVPSDGPVRVDTASPDEMASDAILTRNLRMDDALDAIAALRRRSAGG